MSKMKPQIIFIVLFIITSTTSIIPGTTGKIAGIITDENTGDPLPGATVIVEGTQLGAATDFNGRYVILQVPPGNYTLQISFVGYRKVVVDDVRVNIDQTTEIDVEMEEESIEVDEVVITAERKIIKTDVATSVISVTDKEIEALPITSVVSAIGLQAGVRGGWPGDPNDNAKPEFVRNYTRGNVSVQGGLSIRGGGGETILFELDGVTLRDPRNNEPITRIPLSGVKEVTVERGGFNAEYGAVQSGVVNVVSKEGNRQGYSGNIQVRYSSPSPKYWRGDGILDVHDPYSFALRPFYDPAVCWVGTENGDWDEFTRNQYPSFIGWNEVSRILNSDTDPSNDLTPLGAQRVFMYETRKKQINDEPDFDIDAGFGGPFPFVGKYLGNLRFYAAYRSTRQMLLFPMTRPDYRDYDISLQVSSDITPSMKLRFSGLTGKQFTMRNNWDANGLYFYPRSPSDIASIIGNMESTADMIRLFGNYDLALSDIEHHTYAGKFTHTISANTFYEVAIEYIGRNYDTRPSALRDTSQLFEILPGFFENSNPLGYYPGEDDRAIIITGGQHVAKARDFSSVSSVVLKADFTSQINFQNLVKGGVEFDYNDLNFDYGTIQSGGQATNAANDIYQNRVQFRVFPIRASAYLQDKLEVKEFTINAGLRLDYSNSNTEWWVLDPYERDFFSSQYKEGTDLPKESSEPQWQLSPRLGVAHPITEKSKLFFNYGHFKQLPQYESMFRIERDVTGAVTAFGNPNIILAKTISYELGFDYLIFEDFLIQAAAFYNDITDQQDVTSYISNAGGFSYNYTTSNNYQDTRGFELTLRKTGGDWWSGFANYTYQVTTSGHFGSSRQYDDLTEQKRWDEATVNLYQDRPIPQPYARANFNLTTPIDFGPAILDHNIFGGLGLNVTFDWQAGYWTTWNPGNLPNVAYNVQAVDYYNTYLRFDKTIDIGDFRIQLFVDINNLLNTRRLWNTGDVNYLSSLHLPQSADYTNIPGDDKVGDYREPGVEFQPMINGVDFTQAPGEDRERAWFFQKSTGKYFQYSNGEWSEVDQNLLNKALEDKAYIDMPNASTFWFLNPRQIFFGLKFSFNIGN